MNVNQPTFYKHFTLLFFVLIISWFVNISLGSVYIPVDEITTILFGGNPKKESWQTIIIHYRFPKAITAILVGSGLSLSGLLMQTLFRNPLAGPFVLGISSGASLGVAFFILGASLLGIQTLLENSQWSIVIASSLGAFLVLLAVITTAYKIKNTMSILIIGLMFGSLTSSIISILSYFSSAEKLQQFQFWTFGSLGNLSWQEIQVFLFFYIIASILCFSIIKPLNSLLLGENYAKSLGINIKKSRNLILIITCLFTGVITAFVGPIAFIGLAVPHLVKLVFNTSNHKTLLPATALTGAIIMLLCDCLAQLPNSEFTLPINAVTSLFGAPIVIWLIIRKKKIYF